MANYDYSLEKFCPEYKALIARQAAIAKEQELVESELTGLQAKEAAAHEAWLQSEVDGLLKADKTGRVEKAKLALDAVKAQRRQLSDKAAILERASKQLTDSSREVVDLAKHQVIQAARHDHEGVAQKTIEAARQLSVLQVEEQKIIKALSQSIGSNSCLFATANRIPLVGDATAYGTGLFYLIRDLQNRGYGV